MKVVIAPLVLAFAITLFVIVASLKPRAQQPVVIIFPDVVTFEDRLWAVQSSGFKLISASRSSKSIIAFSDTDFWFFDHGVPKALIVLNQAGAAGCVSRFQEKSAISQAIQSSFLGAAVGDVLKLEFG